MPLAPPPAAARSPPPAAGFGVAPGPAPPLIFAPLETVLVHRLTVAPAGVPARELQHVLLPPQRDRTPGNAAIDYLRAGLEMPQRPRLDPEESQRRSDLMDHWRTT